MNGKSIIICMAALLAPVVGSWAQGGGDSLLYRAEMFSAASSNHTPFWIASNRYGLAPLEAPSGYLSAGVFYKGHASNGLRWEAGLDVTAVTPRYRNVTFRQIYGELAYKSLLLTVGSKEQYTSLWDRELGSGDLVASTNARPIPEIKVSIPAYTPVWRTRGWLQMRGSFSTGRSFDTDYLASFANERQTYVRNILWHYKSLHFRIKDTRNNFPLSFEFGFQHGAQWGGISTNPRIGAQPQSIEDYARVIFGMSGGDGATASDSINVLGNQYGSYDFRLNYIVEEWGVHAYHQRYFEDKSGMEFVNGCDGLWGLQLDLPPALPWLQKVVFEILETRNQSGPFHFIDFDHKVHPGVGGGSDNYYNNGEYTTGLSYFNRSVGSPLLPSPEYNLDGSLGFRNTRVHSLHFGLSGNLSRQVGYRVLFTSMETWGSHARPYLNRKTGMSGLCEVAYQPACLKGWTFTGMLAADRGDFLNKKGIGGGLIIAKRGIVPTGRTR